ncbi:DUF3093 domain-containing protein [Nocardioides solisilvae]|uniref:DUF3093 domain-containing protein n=1 Tax=Nocardioides solisilvae TaxID=1542435 RepID=UPI000D7482F7|nr:DUF3093 domain-containing protein [Nocardioides solisilvae]
MEYAERLHVPLRWWVQGTMLVASLWLAVLVAVPETTGGLLASLAVAGVATALMACLFLSLAARVVVADGVLRAGRAHIEVHHLGAVEVLDAARTRAVTGVEADARAFLLIRPYLKRSVRVEITDPRDPAPYWLLHSRHPGRLAAALEQAVARRMTDRAAG